MANCLELTATKMNFRKQSTIFVLTAVLAHSIPLSLAIFGIFTKENVAYTCYEVTGGRIICDYDDTNDANATDTECLLSYHDCITNLRLPHIRVAVSEGFFRVVVQNVPIFPQVRAFFMLALEMDFEIELVSASAKLSIACVSNRSFSKVSSNILKSSMVLKDAVRFTGHEDRSHLYEQTVVHLNINEQDMQSGHLTCYSVDDGEQAKTIRIFTQAAAKFDASPFVPVRESTTQRDATGHGFIVPCRTNYRLETAPYLLWRKYEKDRFSVVTADEMKSFTWDPRVGFQFNSSKRMWDMKIIACRLGPYEEVFLPSAGRFMNMYVATVVENQLDCALSQRNRSNKHLRQSELNMIEKRSHQCVTDISCDLYWELGILEHSNYIFQPKMAGQTLFGGIFSCSFEHIYGKNRVPETSYTKFFEGLDSKIYLLPGSYPNSSVIQITQVNAPLYKSKTELYFEFSCTTIDFIKGLSSPVVEFIFSFKDSTEVVSRQILTSQPGKASSVARLNALLDSNLTRIICLTLTNEGEFISAESRLEVIDASAPLIENTETTKLNFHVGDLSDNHTLVCPITGAPPPKYQWIFDEKNTKLVTGNNTRYLKFRQIHEDLAGNYICQAWNEHGNNSFEFQVSVQAQGFFSTLNRTTIAWIGFGTILGLLGIGGSMVSVFKYLKAKRQMRNLTTEEALEFLNGIPVSAEHTDGRQRDGSELALRFPFTKRIESNVLIVARDLILGKGQYGIVYRGFLHAEAVAVKAFKRAVTYDEFRAGLVEVKLMNFVGEHPNIVRFIGADVTNIEKRDILIVMELSPLGSLEKHLRFLKKSIPPSYANTTSLYSSDNKRSMLHKLFGFCEQIAFAMEHLESKHVVHGDCAARSVLVFNHDVVKVTDFGYSRQLYENNVYKPKKNRSLPWRSASIELLRQMQFSTESDIWAFGVTVWEIFTFGNIPFASLMYSEQFVKSLEDGLRLEKPAGLCESQYAFLKECWNVEKSGRPRFSELKFFFSLERF